MTDANNESFVSAADADGQPPAKKLKTEDVSPSKAAPATATEIEEPMSPISVSFSTLNYSSCICMRSSVSVFRNNFHSISKFRKLRSSAFRGIPIRIVARACSQQQHTTTVPLGLTSSTCTFVFDFKSFPIPRVGPIPAPSKFFFSTKSFFTATDYSRNYT